MSKIKKGEEIVLTDIDPSLKHIMIGLGWDVPEKTGNDPIDLDASAFLLNHHEKARQDTDFIFYNNLEAENGNVKHLGDNTTGEGDGDDEKIEINLSGLSFDIDKIVFSVTIHNSKEREQTFGLVSNAYMRIVNIENNTELARFDLTEDASDEDSFIFGEILRDLAGWKFKAIGEGSNGGLFKIAQSYNINVAPN